jgi:hypothetical protein
MKALKDNNGELLVKVPSSNWYNYVGTKKYVPGIVASNFDEVVVRGRNLKKAVKTCIDYNSCTDKYWRDQSGKLLRYNNSHRIAIDMRQQTDIQIHGHMYDPLSLHVGLYVPFTDGRWRLITGITDNMVELDGEKLIDKPYIISEMIGYMYACLPNKNGIDMIVSDFNGELHTVINGFYVEDSDTEKQVESNIEMYRKTHTSLDETVDHPSHYNHGGRETIDDIKEHLENSDWNAYQGGLLFNVYKYIDRAPYKGKRLEDLNKARWYLDKLIDEENDNENH